MLSFYCLISLLTDVVAAYKELQKEKVALEESLRALSIVQSADSTDPGCVQLANNQIQLVEPSGNEELNCSEQNATEFTVKCGTHLYYDINF